MAMNRALFDLQTHQDAIRRQINKLTNLTDGTKDTLKEKDKNVISSNYKEIDLMFRAVKYIHTVISRYYAQVSDDKWKPKKVNLSTALSLRLVGNESDTQIMFTKDVDKAIETFNQNKSLMAGYFQNSEEIIDVLNQINQNMNDSIAEYETLSKKMTEMLREKQKSLNTLNTDDDEDQNTNSRSWRSFLCC